jgi:hypothetical protein
MGVSPIRRLCTSPVNAGGCSDTDLFQWKWGHLSREIPFVYLAEPSPRAPTGLSITDEFDTEMNITVNTSQGIGTQAIVDQLIL